MAKINLLPWRLERRKQKQKEFGTMLGVAAVIAVGLSFLIVMYYNGQISGQENRNAYLTTEIATIDKQLEQIKDLDKKKSDLLSRKKAIECLQGRRSLMVHLFDDLVRTIPDGVKLTGIEQDGSKLTVNGSSQSNARVSAYMRNLQVSGWMGQPELTIIEARGGDKGLPYQFSLVTTIRNPSTAPAETEVANAAAAPGAAAPSPATSPATPAESQASDSDECDLDSSASGGTAK
ncbi:MAG: PilN domain-containing protein [Arenimonas sp.]